MAFQFGDGITNIFTPTSGYFMAALAAGRGVSWVKQARWIWPLIVIQFVLGVIFVTVAHLFIFQSTYIIANDLQSGGAKHYWNWKQIKKFK